MTLFVSALFICVILRKWKLSGKEKVLVRNVRYLAINRYFCTRMELIL